MSTSYPSTVRIRVTERVAVGYRLDADDAVLVDADDVQFATVARAPRGLPELAVTGDEARSAAAATVAAALPASFAGAVSRITVPTVQTITLTLTDGRTVLWGGTDRSGEKAKLVPVLVHQPGRLFRRQRSQLGDQPRPVAAFGALKCFGFLGGLFLCHFGFLLRAAAFSRKVRPFFSAGSARLLRLQPARTTFAVVAQVDITLTVYLRMRVSE